MSQKPLLLSETELAELKAEMKRDGLKIREGLKAKMQGLTLPLELPLYVTRSPYRLEESAPGEPT